MGGGGGGGRSQLQVIMDTISMAEGCVLNFKFKGGALSLVIDV